MVQPDLDSDLIVIIVISSSANSFRSDGIPFNRFLNLILVFTACAAGGNCIYKIIVEKDMCRVGMHSTVSSRL